MGHQIELLYDASSFLDLVQKTKKEKRQPPQVIFMDIDLQGGNGFDLFQFLVREHPLWAKGVCFWTNVSYGTYEKQRKEIPSLAAFFLPKNRVDLDLKKIVPQFEKSGEPKDHKPSLSFLERRHFLQFEADLKGLTDLYYEGGADKKGAESFLNRLISSAEALQWTLIACGGKKLLALMGVATPANLKLKKEFKELLALCEKEMKKY